LAIEHIVKKSVSEDSLFKAIKKGKIFPELLYELDVDIDIITAEEIRNTKNELFESKIYSIQENSRIFNFIRESSEEKKFHIWTNSTKYKVEIILEFNKYDEIFTTIIFFTITNGTTIDQYFTSIPVPQTSLLITDRLAIRIYVIQHARYKKLNLLR
jgi:hypothetical protein